MRLLSLDQTAPGNILINFSVWNGIAAPEGHLKMVIKVTLPPEKGMMGPSKFHREDIKWSGSRKGVRLAILDFFAKSAGKEKDIKDAMEYVSHMFI